MKALKERNRYRRRREAYGRREKRARDTGFLEGTGRNRKRFKTIDESAQRRELVQKETRSLRKAGEESAGKGIPEGTGRNRKMF